MTKKHTLIEKIAEKVGLIPDLHKDRDPNLDRLTKEGDLTQFPPMDQWDDWTEYEAKEHPKRVKRNYTIFLFNNFIIFFFSRLDKKNEFRG